MLKEVCIEDRSARFNEQQAILPIMTALFVDGLSPFGTTNPKSSDFVKLACPQEGTRVFRLPLTDEDLLSGPHKVPTSGAECESPIFNKPSESSGSRQITVRFLIRGISHHFNNLLMGIWGNATLIRMQLVAEDPLFVRMVQMERLIQSSAFLIHMVLGYLGERRTVAKRIRLNQLIMEIKNEIQDCGGNEKAPWNFEARLKWASRVQKPRMIASSTARVLEVLFQGLDGHCRDIDQPGKERENDVHAKLATIRSLVKRGLDIIQQLRHYAGDFKSRNHYIHPDVLVKRSILQITKRNPGICVRYDIEENLPTILVDRRQLEFALVEVFNNSVAAMPAGGNLDIGVRKLFPSELQKRCGTHQYGCDYTVISIADNGHGISAKVQKRVFEPFYAYPVRNGKKGLGLAAVDGILSTHKGYVQLQSKLGKGTLIQIYLPVST